ncbi:18209_t:CDS:2, partial [Dentiscutata erythropus]
MNTTRGRRSGRQVSFVMRIHLALPAEWAAGASYAAGNVNPQLRFKNEIRNLVENYYFNTSTVTNDRDKDLMLSERVYYVMYDVPGVIVSNIGFTSKAVRVARELGVILAVPDQLLAKLRFYVSKIVNQIDTEILSEIMDEEGQGMDEE